MPYPKCKEFCASTGVRHEEAKLKGQGSGLLEFKGHQGPEMVNVEELCWCVRPYTQRTFTTSPGPWPLVRLVSGVVNELLGWLPKERSPSLAPGPFW